MSRTSDDTLREELQAAIVAVRRQIEVQQASTHYVGDGPISADAIGELRAELIQLEGALADLGR